MEFVNVYNLKLQIDKKCEIYDSTVKSSEKAAEIINLVLELNSEAVEKVGVITLTNHDKVAGIHIIAVGSQNWAHIKVRDVFVPALLNNSDVIILFHNHPSGSEKPSVQDVMLTETIVRFGDQFDTKIFDHIIVADDKYYSMRDNKDVDFTGKMAGLNLSKFFENN
ncbi:MAG: hypothetical protein FWE04_08155 [Oscillospiraceae bacterium]|nr:hypothetical protein [Oscillospiraceae bacterium]